MYLCSLFGNRVCFAATKLPKRADSSSKSQPKFLFFEIFMCMHTRARETRSFSGQQYKKILLSLIFLEFLEVTWGENGHKMCQFLLSRYHLMGFFYNFFPYCLHIRFSTGLELVCGYGACHHNRIGLRPSGSLALWPCFRW